MENNLTIETCPFLPVELPEAAILARLGRNRFRTAIAPEEAVRFRLWMQEALDACNIMGRWTLIPVTRRDETSVTLDGNWRIESAAFAAFAGNAPELWLGGVTAGDGIARLIQKAGSDMVKQVVLDASGSEIADDAVALMQSLARQKLLRFGKHLSKERFSAGYGGVELCHQKEIFRRLKLEELGIKLTESCIMQPEKSVTAFARVNCD